MSNRIKIILGYLLGFVCSLIVSLLTILVILKFTIYNSSYVYNLVNKNDYYNKVSLDIREEMENYMVSSGFLESILDDIYTIDDVKKDINNYLDNLYLGQKTNVDKEKIESKLNDNIDKYLKESNLSVINEDDIKSFVSDISSIYEKEVTLYHTFDSFLSSFAKINKLINIGIIVSVVLVIVLFVVILKGLKTVSIGSSFIAASLILIFIRFVIVEKVDIENILLITENFSDILQIILLNIRKLLLISGIILAVLGFAIIVSTSYNKKMKVLKTSV